MNGLAKLMKNRIAVLLSTPVNSAAERAVKSTPRYFISSIGILVLSLRRLRILTTWDSPFYPVYVSPFFQKPLVFEILNVKSYFSVRITERGCKCQIGFIR